MLTYFLIASIDSILVRRAFDVDKACPSCAMHAGSPWLFACTDLDFIPPCRTGHSNTTNLDGLLLIKLGRQKHDICGSWTLSVVCDWLDLSSIKGANQNVFLYKWIIKFNLKL